MRLRACPPSVLGRHGMHGHCEGSADRRPSAGFSGPGEVSAPDPQNDTPEAIAARSVVRQSRLFRTNLRR